MKDDGISSDSNLSSNGNNLKKLSTFLIAAVGLILAMGLVGIMFHLKNRYAIIEKIYLLLK